LDSGQFLIESTVVVGEQIVVQPHEPQDRHVKITDMAAVDNGFGTEVIRLSVAAATLCTATG
jgi:hypothetical protein